MSCKCNGSTERSLSADDLLEIRERFKELTKEKEVLRDSKSQGFELIRTLELHVKTLSEARQADRKHIEELERELKKCCQEIDYLQDHLNMKNVDLDCIGEQVCNLQLELADMENLAEEVVRLREELKTSESKRSILIQQMEDKEVELRHSTLHAEKLEESISSMGLEYQCEIESTKLESIGLRENLFEMKKLLEEKSEENSRMNELIDNLQHCIKDANEVIESLEKENRDLRGKLQISYRNGKTLLQVEDECNGCLWSYRQPIIELESNESSYSSLVGPLISTHAIQEEPDTDLNNKISKMSHQIDEYELLVKQLKEELRNEKLKAKEDTEDLAQEMAELRYQLTSMLDIECKRRASIEQISLQRIAELEAEIAEKRKKSAISQDLVIRNP